MQQAPSSTTARVVRATRRGFLAGAGSLATAALLAACGADTQSKASALKAAPAKVDGDLHLFMWDGYVPEAVISSFEREHGVQVTVTNFSTEEEMLKKLTAGLPFDLSFVASNYLTRAVEGGLLRRVDHDAMSYYDDVLPAFQTTGYEPANTTQNKVNAPYVGIPYALGGVGLAWLTPHLGASQSGSFDDLWKAAAGPARKHSFAFDESQFTLAMALAHLGKDINSSSRSDLDAAADSLLQLKPDLAGFSGTTATPQIVDGSGWMQMAYAGDTYVALTEAKQPGDIRWEQCHESAIYNNDNCCIPAAARHPGTATVFMDHLLRPENMKKIVPAIGYIVPTKTGVAAYNDLVGRYSFLKTDPKLLEDFSQWVGTLQGSTLQMWQAAWTRVKAS